MMIGDVGRVGDRILVPRDEHIVLGRDEVGLDEIGALLDREVIGRQRMLGTQPARAAMGDHDGRGVWVFRCHRNGLPARDAKHQRRDP